MNSYAIEPKPNIILVSIDTLRADHLETYSYNKPTSPEILRLSREGLFFNVAYTSYPWTMPAHASMLTGTYGYSHKAEYYNSYFIPKIENYTIAEILKQNNYYTQAFVNSNHVSSGFGFNKGFDNWQESFTWNKDDPLENEAQGQKDIIITREVTQWLDKYTKENSKPFFLFIHYWSPHYPYQSPPEYVKMFLPGLPDNYEKLFFTNANIEQWNNFRDLLTGIPDSKNVLEGLYDGEIRYIDTNIKILFEKLKELGIYDNTLLIITSDHGEEFYEHKNDMHGMTAYNESIRVPLIFKLPDTVRKEHKQGKCEIPVSIVGIAPTILDILGITSETAFDFPSLKPFMVKTNNISQTYLSPIFIENKRPIYANFYASINTVFVFKSLVTTRFKYISYWPETKEELYDILKDPQEKYNLIYDKKYYKTKVDFQNSIQNNIQKTEDAWVVRFNPNRGIKRISGRLITEDRFLANFISYQNERNKTVISDDAKTVAFSFIESSRPGILYLETENSVTSLQVEIEGYGNLTLNDIRIGDKNIPSHFKFTINREDAQQTQTFNINDAILQILHFGQNTDKPSYLYQSFSASPTWKETAHKFNETGIIFNKANYALRIRDSQEAYIIFKIDLPNPLESGTISCNISNTTPDTEILAVSNDEKVWKPFIDSAGGGSWTTITIDLSSFKWSSTLFLKYYQSKPSHTSLKSWEIKYRPMRRSSNPPLAKEELEKLKSLGYAQ